MLGTIRKFSSSIFAKVFLFIVAIPFIFWGMGDVFRSGNLNTIVKIDNDKISSKDFVEYLNNYTDPNEELKKVIVMLLRSLTFCLIPNSKFLLISGNNEELENAPPPL